MVEQQVHISLDIGLAFVELAIKNGYTETALALLREMRGSIADDKERTDDGEKGEEKEGST